MSGRNVVAHETPSVSHKTAPPEVTGIRLHSGLILDRKWIEVLGAAAAVFPGARLTEVRDTSKRRAL